MRPRTLTPRWYAALALGVAAFIVYGSFVPFRYVARPFGEAVAEFQERVPETAWPKSKSDWAANWSLGVPLGFCLLGALRADRYRRPTTVRLAVLALPVCVAFSACVEFGQLFFAGRSCCGSDIWAQGLGAACGLGAWVAFGQRFTDAGRRSLDQLDGTRTLLIVYLLCTLFVQMLPFDLLSSPADWYRRARDRREVTVVPLGEVMVRTGVTAVEDWKKVGAWCELLAMALPGGVLLAGLTGRWRSVNALPQVFGIALGAGLLLELAQWPVASRHPSSTDVLILAFGCVVGWGVALAVTDRGSRGYRPQAAAVFGQLWFAVLAVHHWQPFDFRPPLLLDAANRMSALPFESQVGKAYLWGLEEIIAKASLFVPLGVIASWGWKRTADGRALTYSVLACVAVAAVLEFGQLILPARVASPTDLLFAAAGGWLGAFVTRRRLNTGAGNAVFIPRSRPVRAEWWQPAAPAPTPDKPTTRVES